MTLEAMLAFPLEARLVDTVLKSADWAAEEKLDGVRVLIETRVDGRAVARNRRGDRFVVPRALIDLFSTVGLGAVFDGELVDGVYHPFDLIAGDVTVNTPWRLRREALDVLLEHLALPADRVRPVPFVRDLNDKVDLIERVQHSGGEGVVFKAVDAPYRPGKRSRDMLKLKFTSTVDCVVAELGNDKRNMSLVLFGPDGPVPVGECTRLAGDGPRVQVGDVVTVTVLGVSANQRLVQPTAPVIRTGEKHPEECTLDQLDSVRRA